MGGVCFCAGPIGMLEVDMSDIEHGGKPRVYVSAFFCESVVREKNDLLTAIRINEGVRPLRVTPQLPDGTPDLRNRSLIFQPLRISAVVKFCSEEPTEFMFRLNGTRGAMGRLGLRDHQTGYCC